jgi:proline dehydrogenase
MLGVAGMQQKTVMDKNGRLKQVAYRLGKIVAIKPGNHVQGIEVCHWLHHHGIASTLGKFSRNGDNPAQIVHEYQKAGSFLLDNYSNEPFYLSLKPPALEFNIDYTTAIALTAFKYGHAINFDAHDHILAEPTIKLLEQLMDRIGADQAALTKWRYCLTLPSRWKRSLADADWVISKGLRARLVKGEFKACNPRDEMDPVKGFLELTDRLAGKIPEIAVATHDYELARQAVSRIKKTDTAVQLELIFGMPTTDMILLSKQLKIPARFYVPYGDTLFIYGFRQFLTNPHKLLRPNLPELFSGHKSKLSRIVTGLAANNP